MFVRWKKYARKFSWCDGPSTLQAVLVECHRVNGKPKQKIVATLGTIKEDAIEKQEELVIAYFLLNVRRNLERINLDPWNQPKIDEVIYRKIGEWDQQREIELLCQLREASMHILSRGQLIDLFPVKVTYKLLTHKI